MGGSPPRIQGFLDQMNHQEAQKLINTIDYRHDRQSLQEFIDYSIITNYYTMNRCLNPIVKDLLNRPENMELRHQMLAKHQYNLSFYG